MMRFYHLHAHSMYSSLDSVIKPLDAVEWCKKNKVDALCFTDHGTLAVAYELHKSCTDAGIKPVIGLEAYYVDDLNKDEGVVSGSYSHIVLICKNEEGWHNIKYLQANAWQNGFYKKPRIDFATLSSHSDGLICTTACTNGIVGAPILGGGWFGALDDDQKNNLVRSRIDKFHKLFGDDFYFEIMLNNLEEQTVLNKRLLKLGRVYDKIKFIVTNDCHYINAEDNELHDVLKCIAFKKMLSDPDNGTYETKMLWMATPKEMLMFRKQCHPYLEKDFVIDAMDNTAEIVDKVESFEIKCELSPLPKYSKKSKEMLRKLCYDRWSNPEGVYKERLEYELSVIEKLGMSDYFLIIYDIAQEARKRGIPFNTRGSVAGSLVAYLIGISWIDPVIFKTTFERFLTEDRLSLPDIDMDFGKDRRTELIQYLREKYGDNSVTHIVNFSIYKPKQALKDVARVYGLSFAEVNRVTKQIKDNTEDWEEILELKDVSDFLRANPEVYEKAQAITGVIRHRGIHASGVVLTPANSMMWLPVAWSTVGEDNKKERISEYDMYALEDLNILKIDFLGQNTLDIIQYALELIGDKKLENFDKLYAYILNNLNDEKVYETIRAGDLVGVFQLGTSDGMRDLTIRIKPQDIFEIAICISLYRTAVLEVGAHEKYINRRDGNEEVEYLHPKMESVLKDTQGIMLYQEQVMAIPTVLAGFTKSESDNFRKGIKQKDSEKFKKWEEKFINGCKQYSDIDSELADEIWNELYAWSGYGFNKCLSGDTEIYRPSRRTKNQKVTIGELYKVVHDLQYAKENNKMALRKKLRSNGYGKILSMESDDKIRPNSIKEIYYNGIQKVYRVELENGMCVDGTKNHRFFLDKHTCKSIEMLKIGDELLVDVGSPKNNGEYTKRPSRPISSGKYGVRQCGFPKGENNPSYKDGNTSLFKTNKTKLKNKKCKLCGAGEDKRLEIHHIDGNTLNNDIGNLVKLCSSCHKKEDYKLGKRSKKWGYGHLVGKSKVVSIKYIGEIDTYDVEMDTFEHNYIANGIVSHNSHAISYALISYITMWLKIHYPVQFYTALLSFNTDDDVKMSAYINDAKKHGVILARPLINLSTDKFKMVKDKILYPFSVIKNVGDKAITNILETRNTGGKFKSFEDFYGRVNKRVVNVRIISNLIFAKMFRKFGTMDEVYNQFEEIYKDKNTVRVIYCNDCKYKYPVSYTKKDVESNGIVCPECGSTNIVHSSDIVKKKKFNDTFINRQIFGFSLDSVLKPYLKDLLKYDVVTIKSALDMHGDTSIIGAVVNRIKKHIDKNGNEMAFLSVTDGEDTADVIIFSSSWQGCGELIKKGAAYALKVKTEAGDKFILANGMAVVKLNAGG